MFAPGVTGRFTVAGKYWCDAEVQRCPAISAALLWPTFSFQLYCPNPYWHSVEETLAATIGEEAVTLEDVYEPYLLQIGFLTRTPRGRCVTQLAYEHLHLPSPVQPAGTQLSF